MRDRNFPTIYRIQHLAVHVYAYTARMRLAGREIDVEPGDLTLTPPGADSSYHLVRPGTHIFLHVPVPETGGPVFDLPLHFRLGGDATMARERMVRILDHVGRARGRPDGPASAAAAAAVLELLAWLAERSEGGAVPDRAEQAVARAALELRLHPERAMRVRDLAAQVGMSHAYLARRFRQRFGHTLARYQLIQRVGAAQALLACTTEPIGRIGAKVGVPDRHHFNKLFRRIAGCPPSVFRARHSAGE